ncbi:hypothetical protein AAEP93_011112 [Penicillium crustosum]
MKRSRKYLDPGDGTINSHWIFPSERKWASSGYGYGSGSGRLPDNRVDLRDSKRPDKIGSGGAPIICTNSNKFLAKNDANVD